MATKSPMHDPNDPVLDPMIDPRTGEYAVIAPGHNFRSVTHMIADIVLTSNTPLGWFGGLIVAGGVATLQKRFMTLGVSDIDPHGFIPAIGSIAKLRIKRRPQLRDQFRKRIGEIFVFAAPKAVASHHHPAAEMSVVRIKCCERAAFVGREQPFQDSTALRIEVDACLRPIDGLDARGDVGTRCGADDMVCGGFHGANLANRDALRHPISGRVPSVVICEPPGRRQAPPDDRLREAIHIATNIKLDCFVASAPLRKRFAFVAGNDETR